MAKKNENNLTGYVQSRWEITTKHYCMTLGLRDEPDLINEYEEWHHPDKIWKEIPRGLREVGILDMEIYRFGNLLIMILTVPVDFDFDAQMKKLAGLPRQTEWEDMMAKYQQAVPGTSSAERWLRLERVFKLP
jgi:L-rhamnose mutarotase